jgi:hypothetical protein
MSQQELLKRIIQILDGLQIQYMVTGSVTSSLQGEPRSTHDIDLVVDLTEDSASRLRGMLPPSDFYVSDQAIREALSQRTTFNLIDLTSGDKVDFWILTDQPFDRSRFARRQIAEVAGTRFSVSAPEDTILMKLCWAEQSGGSQKQFTDALRVYEVQHGVLDVDYLNEWASRLGIDSLWQRLRNEAIPL